MNGLGQIVEQARRLGRTVAGVEDDREGGEHGASDITAPELVGTPLALPVVAPMYVHSSARPIESDSATLEWTLVVAGGDRVRLADGLDRLNQLTPASRTLTIVGPSTDPSTLEGRSDHAFRPPSPHNTGLAIVVALAMIKRWTPNAIVTLALTDEDFHVEHVRIARGMAARMRDQVLVLGELVLGEALVEVPDVRTVVELVDAQVVCGTATAVWELGRAAQPELMELLDFLTPLLGMPDEFDAIDHVYRSCPPISFSRDFLERFPERLMAMVTSGVERGHSERIPAVVDRASAS